MNQRVAVVTGATSGIGRACAAELTRNGYAVLATGRRADELERLAAEGKVTRGYPCDIQEPGAAGTLLAEARSLGRPSVYIASAGVGVPGTILSSDERAWDRLIRTNYLSLLHQLRDVAEFYCGLSDEEPHGARAVRDLVVIGSTVGREVSNTNPVYGSTKFAAHALVEALRREVCGRNIRVSLIEPGFVRTGFQETSGYDMESFDSLEREQGPFLTPEDVARSIAFVVNQPPHVHLDDLRIRPTRQRV